MQLVARVDEVALCTSFSSLIGSKVPSLPTKITYDKEAMKARMSEIIEKLASDQCEHFVYAIEQVASCYMSPSSHGALLIANESDESQSLVAINASEMQISEMVGFMAAVIEDHQASPSGKYVN